MPGRATPQLNSYANALEREVLARVEAARALLTHAGAKGQLVELAFRDALVSVLGGRFSIGTGQVIDTRGRMSGQMDLVLYNEEQILPPRNSMDPALFLVDAVDTVVEIKTELRLEHIDKIAENAANQRGPKHVKRAFGYGDSIPSFVTPSAFTRFYMAPGYALIASETKLLPDRLIARLASLDSSVTFVGEDKKVRYHLPPLDAVFVLGLGEFRNIYRHEHEGPALTSHRPSPTLAQGNWEFYSAADTDRTITSSLLAAAVWFQDVSPKVRRRFPAAMHYFMEPGGATHTMHDVEVHEFVVNSPLLTRLSPHVHPPV